MVPNFGYVRPTTLAQAIGQLGAPGAKALDAEKLLVGNRLEPKAIGLAAAAAVKAAVPLEHNGYKVAMFRGLVQEVLEGLVPMPRKTT